MAPKKFLHPSDKVTPPSLRVLKKKRGKIVALTAYDSSMARLLDAGGVDVILVGDSVGNVKLGHASTVPVTLAAMLHHTAAVRRGVRRALLVADMPFLTYEIDPREAVRNAGRLVQSAGAEAVKVEGGDAVLNSVKALVRAKIPVMGHLGLTPQSVLQLGGYRSQGRTVPEAKRLFDQAKRLEAAGVFALVLEAVPAALARRVTKALSIPTIGIGAGASCDGQILVLDDMLGLTEGHVPSFVKQYAALREEAARAVARYRDEVRSGRFPGPENTPR